MIPPLSQSRQALLACPHRYHEEQILGQKQVAGEAARRGSAIHTLLQMYVRGLVNFKKAKDASLFDSLLRGMDPEAREIIEPLREDFTIDPETVFATEQYISMRDNFSIKSSGGSSGRITGDDAFPVAYEMTIDLIELPEPTAAKITDYKSQYEAIDPDTFQARLYSLGVMMLNPQIETVEFQLKFLRWGKARSVKFTREQIPALQKEAQSWRERQVALHAETSPVALPGNHCVYCSLLSDGCPVPANPYEGVEAHLTKALYFKAALKKSMEVLKAHADATGPVRAKDGIGQVYEACWEVQERKTFDINVLPVIVEWEKQQHDPILQKLSISGLTSLLKAKKRFQLSEECANHCEIKAVPRFKVGKVGEVEMDED